MKPKIGLLILRLGMGGVFLVFGIGKFQDDIWAQTIKSMSFFNQLPWSTGLSVIAIGSLEIITAVLLILGLFTRLAAWLAVAQISGILWLLNFQETRDFGLLAAALYLGLCSNRAWGVDWLLYRKNKSRVLS